MPLPRLHTTAFFGAVSNAVDQQPAFLQDNCLTPQGNGFLVPWDMRLIEAWSGGANLTDSRLNSPSVVTYGDLYIDPVELSATPLAPPAYAYYQPESPIFAAQETVLNKVNDTTGTTDKVTTGITICASGDQLVPIPSGQFCAFRFTSTTTVTANAWTQLVATFTTIPPAGTYAIIGLDVVSTNCQLARMILQDRKWRPGYLGRTTQAKVRAHMDNRFNLGVVGYFYPPQYPLFEVLCNAADASFTGWLFCVQISKQVGTLPQ